MNKSEILAKYREQHNNLSQPYYENKRAKARTLRLYLTPQTLVETSKRQVLRQLPQVAQTAIREAFEGGGYKRIKVVRECGGNLNCKDKPYRRFSELTSPQKDEVWEMILDEDEFNYEHQNIWMGCDAELRERLAELEAETSLTMDEEDEVDELRAFLKINEHEGLQ